MHKPHIVYRTSPYTTEVDREDFILTYTPDTEATRQQLEKMRNIQRLSQYNRRKHDRAKHSR